MVNEAVSGIPALSLERIARRHIAREHFPCRLERQPAVHVAFHQRKGHVKMISVAFRHQENALLQTHRGYATIPMGTT
jgi:hypothetical protein